jgi:hypothetical protein
MTTFAEQIKAFTAKAEAAANHSARNIIGDIADELIFRTPVDTGRARANWQLSINQINKKVSPNTFDPDGDATSNKLYSLIPENVLGLSIYIANSVPYIFDLENGKSRQSPNGMLKLTRLRFRSLIQRSKHVSR